MVVVMWRDLIIVVAADTVREKVQKAIICFIVGSHMVAERATSIPVQQSYFEHCTLWWEELDKSIHQMAILRMHACMHVTDLYTNEKTWCHGFLSLDTQCAALSLLQFVVAQVCFVVEIPWKQLTVSEAVACTWNIKKRSTSQMLFLNEHWKPCLLLPFHVVMHSPSPMNSPGLSEFRIIYIS